ncbi:MAG: maleylpyruvate isomerase family mycothiol-dependent enzyme [Bacteroidota bacterium]|nr:maleylpyruvate isomerase family mycothiol-dependent enzyme [Bacteroidota bacterium]
MSSAPPIDVVHLLAVLDKKLLELLRSLSAQDWEKPTIAGKWRVKEVAAHLLDGNIRPLSMLRDQYTGEQPLNDPEETLIAFLNRLNADWVKAMQRVSPSILIDLLEKTGPAYCQYYQSLDPYGVAGFPVIWAGEQESKNWMHIAREYSEKWIHQQQIRDAVKQPGLLTAAYFIPLMDTFLMALPYTYRNTDSSVNTRIQINITGEVTGSWVLQKQHKDWQIAKGIAAISDAQVSIPADIAWRLFSKSLRPHQVMDQVELSGDTSLGETALHMVSVMA